MIDWQDVLKKLRDLFPGEGNRDYSHNSSRSSQPRCLHCMDGYVTNGRCSRCGRDNSDPGRYPRALPMGFALKKGCYQIGRVLGIGGFGITYLAWDSKNQRKVAIKELLPNRVNREEPGYKVIVDPSLSSFFQHIKKRFLEEARMIYDLHGEPGIIEVYDCFEENNTCYYVMQFLDGTDLGKRLKAKSGAMSWQELEPVVRQILSGLNILHSRGLIHRDISPDNIFVCRDGRAMLIDFGSVRRENAGHFTVFLKDSFAPPEQFLSHGDQGGWTDTFSLCATLYYLLSGGILPAGAYERAEKRNTTGIDPIIPIAQYSPASPPYVLHGIMTGLSLDPRQRFQNAEEMRRAFFQTQGGSTGQGRSTGQGGNYTPEYHTGQKQTPTGRGCVVECVYGQYKGRRIILREGEQIRIGRGEEGNGIAYPQNPKLSPGISRAQCQLVFSEGRLYVFDLNSTYGTTLDGRNLLPMRWQEVRAGQTIGFGDERYSRME